MATTLSPLFGTASKAYEASVGDYIALLKPRVMSLVVFTGLIGMLLAPGTIHPLLGAVAILCIALGSGAAGAINMWYDRDIDAIMSRTLHRPLPSGKIAPESALEFAVVLAGFSVFLMAFAVNYMAAALLLAAILFYVFIYTIWLKRRTPQNIVIGGAAGAFPPLIGWASVTGTVSWEACVLFAIIFMWTPPHFWALSLYRNEDYKKANVPMLPVIAGNAVTRTYILAYSILLVFTSLVPVYTGMAGLVYGGVAGVLGARFCYLAIQLKREYTETRAKRLFYYSISYLFLLFTALFIDYLTRNVF